MANLLKSGIAWFKEQQKLHIGQLCVYQTGTAALDVYAARENTIGTRGRSREVLDTPSRTVIFRVVSDDLVFAGEQITPAFGHEIEWTDDANGLHEYAVFPSMDGRNYDWTDSLRNIFSIYTVDKLELDTVIITPYQQEAFTTLGLLAREQLGLDEFGIGGDVTQQTRLTLELATAPLIAGGIAELDRFALITVRGRDWNVDIAGSSWGSNMVRLQVLRHVIARHEEMEAHGAVR